MANVFTIPSSAAFAQSVVNELIRKPGLAGSPLELSRITIFVPTRRAVRSLTDLFTRTIGGAALLPEIRPLGDLDEDELLLDAAINDIELVPAISPVRRRYLLAMLILKWQQTRGSEAFGFAQAVQLARSLTSFLDEVQTQGVDFSKLADLAPSNLTSYWADVRAFLEILVEHWPRLLAEEGCQDPASHRDAALRMLAQKLKRTPPDSMIIAAGSTGSIPATAELLSVLAHLPNGAVILPGLDLSLDEKSWIDLDEGHPQFGMKQLLMRMGLDRKDVRIWGTHHTVNNSREVLLRETLRPVPTTDAWRALAESDTSMIGQGLKGLSLIEASDPAQEATTIALMLRDALEQKGQTAALVTPDRELGRRVAAELKRWKINIDDSGGHPLARTPPGTFLSLIANAAAQNFAPVPLLAMLKHPLASGGEDTAAFRQRVRQLDLCLRGPRPDEGSAGICRAILQNERLTEKERKQLVRWFTKLTNKLSAFSNTLHSHTQLQRLISLHIEAAEALSATDGEEEARLWRGEAGRSAQELVTELHAQAQGIQYIDGASYPSLFRMMAEEKPVRPAFGRHPRLAILGPLEARLQRFDLVILGGLNEGTWPREVLADPWLSRPMRRAMGLEQPERAIGLSAHDFASLVASPNVILTRSRKVNGAPTVPSRWLQRLIQLTRGLGYEKELVSPPRDYCAIAAALSMPKILRPMNRPEPTPPVSARPRGLSVTEIETWLRDPYAIYARHVLQLKPLDPLDAEIGVLERGTVIHKVLEEFIRRFPDGPPDCAERFLIDIADRVFVEYGISKAVIAIWRPRFIKAANWFAGAERERRRNVIKAHVELRGEIRFNAPGGEFVLRGRADRIDELATGDTAIIDYKTGQPPSDNQVKQIIAPQLPLEAAILMEGGFPPLGKLKPAELVYIHFAGGANAGAVRTVNADASELALKAKQLLEERVRQFDRREQPYLPRIMPLRTDIAGDYDHLARVKEWSVSGSGNDE